MNTAVTVLVFAAVLAPSLATIPSNLTAIARACSKTVAAANLEALTAFLSKVTIPDLVAQWPKPIPCYLHCIARQIGLMDSSDLLATNFGTLTMEGTYGISYDALLTLCKTSVQTSYTGTDVCIRTAYYASCMRKNGPSKGAQRPILHLILQSSNVPPVTTTTTTTTTTPTTTTTECVDIWGNYCGP